MNRRYSELITIPSFIERFRYLKLDGHIGHSTFGSHRYLNQNLYHSAEWRQIRRDVIVRDMGCDLAFDDMEIQGRIYIHHLNPIDSDDIVMHSDLLFDPENLVCVSQLTHEAIHYGDESLLYQDPVTRRPNDTCPWKER